MRLLPRSATLRLAGLVFLLQFAGGAVLVGLVWRLADRSVTGAADTVTETVRDDLAATLHAGGVAALVRAIDAHVRDDRPHGVALLLVDSRGRILAGNLAAWPPLPGIDRRAVVVDLFRIGRAAPEPVHVVASPPVAACAC